MDKRLLQFVFSLVLISCLIPHELVAQTCKVTDFIYLNDPQDYNTKGFVHKLQIGTGGTLSEVANANGTTPWFPAGGGLGSPHGLGQDLNGNLYIGANAITGPIAKLKCDGTLVNLNFINDAGYNIVSKDGYLYVNSNSNNRISRYALCDGSLQGYVTLDGVLDNSNNDTQVDWGLSIDKNGTMYATVGFYSANADGLKAIYRFKPTNADFINHTNYTPLVSANNVPPGAAQANLPIPSAWLWGITSDNAGNMYVIAEDPWFNYTNTDYVGKTWILKYDVNGNLVASVSQRQDQTPTTGFKGGRGIVYYETLDVLYVAGGIYGDCIATIRPSDLQYLGAAAANIPGQNPKTLRIASEACPVFASTQVDTTLCKVKVGDKIFLSQLVGACNAPICGGTWTAAQTNVGMTFNQCDLSFTVTGLNGCGKFTLTNTGGTCGDFTIEVNVDFSDVTAPVIAGDQTVCSGAPPSSFSVITPATGSGNITYQWQKSTISCTDGFTDITGAISSTYTPAAVAQTTYYRVIASVQGGCNFPLKTCSDTSNCATILVTAASVSVTPGSCIPANNQYSVSGTLSLTNAIAGTATITDGLVSTTVSVPSNATSVAYSLTGLISDATSHTVLVSLPGCGTTTTTYTAPASCSVAACSINLTPTVSGCYSASGVSKATVSVEVAWANATISPTVNDPSDAILVTYAGQTKSIDPGPYTTTGGSGTIVSPQVVAFEVDLANTTSGLTATAYFTNSLACSAVSGSINLPAPCLPTVCSGNNLGGAVFNDYNADGTRQAGENTGVPNVTVKVYDCSGSLIGTATTDTYGTYSFTNITASQYPLRVEFTNLPGYAGQGTLNGSNGRTTVQFVNAPNCSVDLGILDNTDYCQTNPKLVIPCYVNGDPLAGGTAGSSDAVVSFDYTASGLMDGSIMAHAPASQVGTLWGTAYNKYTKKLFSSATIRRHAGLGPLGLGGIYVADFSTIPANGATFTYTPLLSVTALGVNVGTIADNSTRGLPADKTQPSVDNQAYLAIGKAGIGGIDFSEDGNTLYFSNLYDNKLYSVDFTAYNATGSLPTATDVKVYNVTGSATCPNGNLHIWAVKVHKGRVYTGLVCDAGTSQNKSDLRAYVQELNGTSVSTIFDFPLTYPKGFPWDGGGTSDLRNITGWYPWTDDWTSKLTPITGKVIHPEPILSGIEFDIDGSMVLGLADRTSMQVGWDNYNPNGNDGTFYRAYAGGDVLRAYSNGTSFVLENNAKAGPTVGYAPNNNQGPGFGEFYNDNWIFGGAVPHSENAIGGLALRPGSGEVIEVSMDPINYTSGDASLYYDSGGIRHLSNSTGDINSAYQIYETSPTPGTFGKAAGLGDIVATCDLPTYLEIGNRVWLDSNKDGIQDPCEKSLAGVLVALYQSNTLVATTSTDANGEYYFNNIPTSSTATNVASTTAILANTTYTVRFGTDGTTNQYDNTTQVLTLDGGKYNVTVPFATAPNASTINDSNAQLAGGFLSATVTTGAGGSVNHTIDAGFVCVPTTVASVSVVPATCPVSGTVANSNGQILLTGIQCADKVFLVTAGSAIPSYTATSGQPVSNSATSFTGLANPATSAGQSYSLVLYNGPCCYTVITATLPQTVCVQPAIAVVVSTPVCNSVTNQYTVSGTLSLTNATAGNAILTDGTTSTTVNIATGVTSATYALSGFTSDASSHTLTVAYAGQTASATYTAPSACTIAVDITVTPGVCNSATNQYSISGTLSLTNAVAGTATITDGTSTTTVAVAAGATSVAYSLGGFNSDASSHTVTVAYAGQTASATYTAPSACTLGVAFVITPGTCQSATNQYSVSGTLSLTNAPAGTATFTDGTSSTTVAVTAGASSVPFSLTGLSSGTGSHTVTASFNGQTQTQTYTAPSACTVAVALTVTPGVCNTATNQYSISGTLSLTNAVAGTATISDGTSTTTVAVSAGATSVAYSLGGFTSDASSHTVTVSYAGQTASATYTAPSACTLGVAFVVTPGTCNSATNQYSVSGTLSLTNAPAGTATFTDGTSSTTVAVTAGASSVPFSLTGLTSGTGSHTVTASFNGQTQTQTYTAPSACTIAVALAVTPGVCNTATNQYSISGTLSLTNAVAGTATITDGSSTTTVAVAAGATSVAYSLGGFNSDASSHTVTVSYAGKTASATYTAPSACTLGVAFVVTPGTCNSATNQYSISGTLSLTNAVAGTATITDGSSTTTIAVAAGATSVAYSLDGFTSDASSHTVTVSYAGQTASATYTAPSACTLGVAFVVTPGTCQSATNQYSVSGTLSLTNAPAGTATFTDGTVSTTVAVTAGQASVSFSLTGLTSGTGSHTVTTSFNGQIQTQIYSAPASCTKPILSIDKIVDKSVARKGDTITYTVTLTNSGNAVATNVVVSDSLAIGLHYLANSDSAPTGTTFTQGTPTSLWTVAAINPGQSLTLTLQAVADSAGVLFNTATIPGDTANVCTSVPYKFCQGSGYLLQLSAKPGYSSYQWYRNGVAISGATSYTLGVTTPGSYSLSVNNQPGQCANLSCCPILVEEDTLPTFQAVAIPATCIGNAPQANGQLVLSNFRPGNTFQYSLGSTFNATASLSGAAQAIPVNGVIAANLLNPAANQAYTIRVYNAAGCYQDVTVTLTPTICQCPPRVCVPLVIQQIKGPRRGSH